MSKKCYRQKPVIIEAVQWLGNNNKEINSFMGTDFLEYKEVNPAAKLYIENDKSKYFANVGDYIIKTLEGDFKPCNPDVFNKMYEEVLDE